MVNGIPNLATRQGQLARALERDGAFHLCASHLVEQLFKPIDLLLGALVRSRASPFGPQQVAVILHEREDQETFPLSCSQRSKCSP
jgi:hypothetical protein